MFKTQKCHLLINKNACGIAENAKMLFFHQKNACGNAEDEKQELSLKSVFECCQNYIAHAQGIVFGNLTN